MIDTKDLGQKLHLAKMWVLLFCGRHCMYFFPERWLYQWAGINFMAKNINYNLQDSLKHKVSRNTEDNPDAISNYSKLIN